MIDMFTLKHPQDVKKDIFGKWTYSGSHNLTYKAKFDDEGVDIEKCHWST
jgi:hypothetical protein